MGIRKITALGGALLITGTVIAGSFAYDLGQYPAKYIVDGQFNGKIVVGENAAVPDVLGAVDIAAGLQAASVSKTVSAGGTKLSGDVKAVYGGNLQIRKSPMTMFDGGSPKAFKDGVIRNSQGTTDYRQHLIMGTSGVLQSITTNYLQDDDEKLADYLVFDTTLPFMEWYAEFPQGIESRVEGTALDDIEGVTFNILGADYSIVEATMDGTAVELTLMGGSVEDTLREGETKKYSVDGEDYEVTLVFVSDPNTGSVQAKFSVNGELTDAMEEGDTETVSGGIQIGVRDILVNSRDGVASFYLGANKLLLSDPTADDAAFDGTIEINDESVSEGAVSIRGQAIGSKYKINIIRYRLTMDGDESSVAYVPAGKGVRELMRDPEGLISPGLDIRYDGLSAPVVKPLKLAAISDDRYTMTFTNVNGETYTFPFLSNHEGVWRYGSRDHDLVFVEGAGGANHTIGMDDYIILGNNRGPLDADKPVTRVIRYTDYDEVNRVLSFEDLSNGKTLPVAVMPDGTGTLILTTHSFILNVSNVSAREPTLAMDLDASGTYAGVAKFVTWGGVIVDIAAGVNVSSQVVTSSNPAALAEYVGNGKTLNGTAIGQEVKLSARVMSKNFGTVKSDETLNWTIVRASGDEIDISIDASGYTGPVSSGTSSPSVGFHFTDLDDDRNQGLTDWGILVDEYTDSSGPDELTLHLPKTQRQAAVYVTYGDVTSVASGTTTEKVNPVAVGLAVTDTEADGMVGKENLIVIGGPCANAIAAGLLDNPEQCGAGFEPGMAIIRSWEEDGKVAILVAGYDGADTRTASKVLADYKSHKLSGEEVEVVTTDSENLKIIPR